MDIPHRLLRKDGNVVSNSERLVLDIVRRHDGLTRSAITSHTDLTQPSVYRIIDQLVERGFLSTGASVSGGTRGHPSPMMHLNSQGVYAFGLSINVGSAVVCLADLSCNLIAEVRTRTLPLTREQTLRWAHETMANLCARHRVAADRVLGVGVSVSGYFINGSRQMNTPEPLQDWALIDLAPLISDALKLHVWLENSGNAVALAECLTGVGHWARNFVQLSISYGFGGGIVMNGDIYTGSRGNAGELSQLFPIDEGIDRPTLNSLIEELAADGIQIETLEDLRQNFDPGWPAVERWASRVMPSINRVINGAAGFLDPDAIVFGGQIPAALASMLISRAEFWGGKGRYDTPPDRPILVLGSARGDAQALGAALLPLKKMVFM